MKNYFILLFALLSIGFVGLNAQSNIEFEGTSNLILHAKKDALKATGKLLTGETVKVGCSQGECYFTIEYKDRTLKQVIGSEINLMSVYEFDFGGDNDYEIVITNRNKETTDLHIFLYSKGIIQELFKLDAGNNKTVLRKNYIEYHLPDGTDTIWNFYRGGFWLMTPFK